MAAERDLFPENNISWGTATLIGSAVAIALVFLVTATGTMATVVVAAVAGGSLGYAALLQDTKTPAGTVLTAALLPLASLVVLAALAYPLSVAAPQSWLHGVINVGLALGAGLAAFGVIGTLDANIGVGGLTRLRTTTQKALLGPIVPLVGVFAIQVVTQLSLPTAGENGRLITEIFVAPSNPALGLITFWVLTTVCLGTYKLLVSVTPIMELTARTKKATVAGTLSQLNRLLDLTLGVAVLLIWFSGLLVFSTVDVLSLADRYPAAFALFTASSIRWLLLGTTGIMGILAAHLAAIDRLRQRGTGAVEQVIPAPIAGMSAVAVASIGTTVLSNPVEKLVTQTSATLPAEQLVAMATPFGVLLTVLVVAMGVIVTVIAGIEGACTVGFIPSRSAGSAIAGGGLAISAIMAGLSGAAPVSVFTVVALSIVIWSAGDQSATIRTEVGHVQTLQLDVLHGLSAVGLAGGGALLAWGLYTTVLGSLTVAGGTVVGLVASVTGTLVIIAVLRG